MLTEIKDESLCPPLGSGPTLAQGPSGHVPLLFGTTFHYLSIQPPLEDVSKHTFSIWPPSPVDTGVPSSLLMLRNSLNDFVFEHQSGCCATKPGYAGDIGSIEIWLIDWLVAAPSKCSVNSAPSPWLAAHSWSHHMPLQHAINVTW